MARIITILRPPVAPVRSTRHPAVAALLVVLSAGTVGAQTPARAGAPAAATAAATAATPAAAPAPTAPTRIRESWTADRRGFVVGDIVTVLVDDYTISTAVKENLATDTRTRDLSADVSLPQALSKGAGLTAKNSADQQERGTARRENRFQNEMSVRVIAVGPNGLLQVKGTKSINVDKAAQDIVFTGWIRPQDISAANMVESNRVADAQLFYSSPGALGKPKQGLLSKALGIIWP